jgi:2-hydroxy-3-keto-5-methylthiopentenyl-1-phosphate phosphatase
MYEVCLDQYRNKVVKKSQWHVNLDFDGTVTTEDTLVAIAKHFDLEDHQKIIEAIHARKISIKEGVSLLFHHFRPEDITLTREFIKKNIIIREGFTEFLDFCEKNNIELDIVSGGFDLIINSVIGKQKNIGVYSNLLQNNYDHVSISSPYKHLTCKSCGTCKTDRMFDNKYEIVIGDSVTDFYSARLADFVFARDSLVPICSTHEIPYVSFENFFDIIKKMEIMLTK